MRCKIFRQSVQIIGRHTDVWVPIFGQSDGIRFKQGVCRELCGGALKLLLVCDAGYGLDRTAHDEQDVECTIGGSVKTEPYRKFYKELRVTSFYKQHSNIA